MIGLLAAAGLAAAAPAPAPAELPVAPAPAEAEKPFDILDLLDLDFEIGPWRSHAYVQFDAARYDQEPPGPPETDFRRGTNDSSDALQARDLRDGALLRRARFGGQGTWGADIAYRAMLEVPINDERGQPRIAEVWVRYSRFAPYTVTAGAFAQLANMEDATSSDSTLFLERATAAELARTLGAGDGRLGIMFRRADKRWMAALSLTGPVADHAEDFTSRGALVGRFTRALRASADERVQIGASATWVLAPAEKKSSGDVGGLSGYPIRFRYQPEVKVDDTRLIDTGDIFAKHASVLGLEFAAQRRNLYLQAEAFRFQVERQATALSDPHFFGWYVAGSWILTGEQRRFDVSRGAFWFPKPARPLGQGGWGAIELVARYSRMDLNYNAGLAGEAPPPDGVRGGDQKISALGVVWYPRPRFRVMLDYLHVSVDRLNPAGPGNPEPFGPPPATPPIGVQIGQTFDTVAMRFRYAF